MFKKVLVALALIAVTGLTYASTAQADPNPTDVDPWVVKQG